LISPKCLPLCPTSNIPHLAERSSNAVLKEKHYPRLSEEDEDLWPPAVSGEEHHHNGAGDGAGYDDGLVANSSDVVDSHHHDWGGLTFVFSSHPPPLYEATQHPSRPDDPGGNAVVERLINVGGYFSNGFSGATDYNDFTTGSPLVLSPTHLSPTHQSPSLPDLAYLASGFAYCFEPGTNNFSETSTPQQTLSTDTVRQHLNHHDSLAAVNGWPEPITGVVDHVPSIFPFPADQFSTDQFPISQFPTSHFSATPFHVSTFSSELFPLNGNGNFASAGNHDDNNFQASVFKHTLQFLTLIARLDLRYAATHLC
jgi:hypothetical protein